MQFSPPQPHCHTCEHSELRTAGPLLCLQALFLQTTRKARSEDGECGPSGVFYMERDKHGIE